MKALALTVWDKKIFEVFSFGCHGNQSSSWNSNLWNFLKVHHPRIISVKFHWNLLAGFREDFLSNCSRMDTRRTDSGHWSITIAHPENIVLRWAKKLSSIPSSFREEEFWSWPSLFLCSNLWPLGWAQFWPQRNHANKLIKVHEEMLKIKYQSATPSSFRGEEFWRSDSLFLCSNMWPPEWGTILTPGASYEQIW